MRGETESTYCIANNFHWTKISPSPATCTFCIAEIFGGINFRRCDKGRHILYVIINTGQNLLINISLMRAGGEIGENFRLYGTQ